MFLTMFIVAIFQVIIRIAAAAEKFHFLKSLYQFRVPSNIPVGTLLNESVAVDNQTMDENIEFIVEPPDMIAVGANGALKTMVPFDAFDPSTPVDLTVKYLLIVCTLK